TYEHGPWVVFFSSRRRHTRLVSDWSSDVCSSDLGRGAGGGGGGTIPGRRRRHLHHGADHSRQRRPVHVGNRRHGCRFGWGEFNSRRSGRCSWQSRSRSGSRRLSSSSSEWKRTTSIPTRSSSKTWAPTRSTRSSS